MILELQEDGVDIWFIMNEIDPYKTAKIINKTHIVLIAIFSVTRSEFSYHKRSQNHIFQIRTNRLWFFFCENREPERLNYMHQNHLTSALSKMLLHRKLNTTEVKNSRTENWQQKYCNHFSRQWKWRSFINSKFVVKAQIATVPEGKAVDANWGYMYSETYGIRSSYSI